MNLEIERFEGELRTLRRTRSQIGSLNWRLKGIKSELQKFTEENDCLREDLKDKESFWKQCLVEVEDMHNLQTASLKSSNESLSNMIVRSSMLSLNPPIVPIVDYAKYNGLRNELSTQFEINSTLTAEKENLQARMNALERIIVKSV